MNWIWSFLVLVVAWPLQAQTRVEFCPSDRPAELIVETLASAENSIDVAIYNLSDKTIQATLKAASKRGVVVRLIMDKPTKHRTMADSLESAGMDVRHVSKTMHHKFAIVDGAVVLSGSVNWSPVSFVRYDEDLLRIDDAETAYAFRREFEKLWNHSREYGETIHSDARELPPHAVADVWFTSANMEATKYRGQPTFRAAVESQNGVCGRRVIRAIEQATKSIQIATTHFRRDDIAAALMAAVRRGVRVEIVLDMQEHDQPDTTRKQGRGDEHLAEIGADVRYKVYAQEWDVFTALQMHCKFMIVDGREVLTGSFNWSENSELESFENLMAIRDAAVVKAYADRFRLIQGYGNDRKPKALIRQIRATGEPKAFPPITMSGRQLTRFKTPQQ